MTSAPRLTVLLPGALLVALLLMLAGPTAGASAACKAADKPAYSVSSKTARKATLCLINKQRAKHGMKKLKEDGGQRKAAKKHTRRMLKKGCFSHVCPGEGDLVSRVNATSYLPCNCSWGLGENIAYGFGSQSSPKLIVKAWMKSSGHRANILNRSFEHIGIGIKPGVPTSGGHGATYTTTFGYRD